MRPKKVDSIQLAKYISAKVGDTNHLKLQKLLYYTEAYHLAYFDRSIIDDQFEAWLHGPVSRKLWDYLKPIANVYDNITLKANKKEIIGSFEKLITTEQKEFICDIFKEFGPRTSYELECLTHAEKPWRLARVGYADGDKCAAVISKNIMKEYYKKKLYK